jgi:DNA-directed RNA polymerase subunit RPC12/RpoP
MEPISFICPHCETALEVPEEAWYLVCTHCRNRLDLKAQFAFLRGLDAFSEGQDIVNLLSPRKRRMEDPRMQQAMELFREAYSSLQVAFLFPSLALSQKKLGAEMMTSMANEFMKLSMISAYEMSYWKSLLVELNSQDEYDTIKEQLSNPESRISFLKRIHWQIRKKQLVKALVDLDRKMKMLERQIEFIDKPRGRNENWKP